MQRAAGSARLNHGLPLITIFRLLGDALIRLAARRHAQIDYSALPRLARRVADSVRAPHLTLGRWVAADGLGPGGAPCGMTARTVRFSRWDSCRR